MIEGIRVSRLFPTFAHRRLSLTLFPRTVPGASALAFSLLACAWTLPRLPLAAPDAAQAPVVASGPKVSNPFGAVLVDLRSRARSASAALARRRAAAAESLPGSGLVLSVPAVPATPAARLADNAPLPPRRSEELKSGAAPAAANVSPIPGIAALRLGEATFENTPLPPRRSEELKSDPARTAEDAPPAPSEMRLGENAPENLPLPPRRPDELKSDPARTAEDAPPAPSESAWRERAQNLPLPPRRPDELKAEAVPAAPRPRPFRRRKTSRRRPLAFRRARPRGRGATRAPLSPPPLRPTTAASSKSCSAARRKRPAPRSDTRRRKAASRRPRAALFPAPARRGATINSPPFTTFPRIRSICRTASVWRRIRALAACSTIRASCIRKCAARRRRRSMR